MDVSQQRSHGTQGAHQGVGLLDVRLQAQHRGGHGPVGEHHALGVACARVRRTVSAQARAPLSARLQAQPPRRSRSGGRAPCPWGCLRARTPTACHVHSRLRCPARACRLPTLAVRDVRAGDSLPVGAGDGQHMGCFFKRSLQGSPSSAAATESCRSMAQQGSCSTAWPSAQRPTSWATVPHAHRRPDAPAPQLSAVAGH